MTMLSLIICLLPLAASIPVEVGKINKTSKNLIVNIENSILKDVRFVGNFDHTELNLSDLPGLRALEKNAFDNVLDVESLILANNSLTSLPDFVFSNLTKLKSLSLSDNQISNVRNLFVGLENLQLLDISRNPIRHFGRGHLFGLTKSVKILTDGNILWSISTGVFANSFLKDTEEIKRLAATQNQENPVKEQKIDKSKVATESQDRKIVETVIGNTRLKICKSDGIVTLLEILLKDEELVDGCVEVPVDTSMQVNLAELGIKGFQEDWYRLQSLPVASLDLSNNEITEITKETLNNLPSSLRYVNFQGNKIRRIWSQVIENDHLNILNLRNNLIEEIEEGAFAKTDLHELYLSGNQLESLNFVFSLPDALTVFLANGNHIISIPDGVFSKLFRLSYLCLDNNKIEALQNDVFQGLKFLLTLTLAGNGIKTIEPNAFKGLTTLQTLDLRHNSIRDLQKGTFAELIDLRQLNLANNKISKITFTDLAQSVDSLHLDYNEIDILEEGNFVRTPTSTLSLTGNRISNIMRGAFNLPTLRDLYLNNNTLTTIEGDSYEGLNLLRRLWLSENKISEIRKGACKNLGNLYILDISKNPFQKLENGTLHGLNTAFGTSLYVFENNLKEIQGGVFDDV
ncbi:Leucine-rich repeats and immunoglobulin-like domains protein 3 [Trachymyrmex zeteki]|uniref:Leucine-rich repeats and immunoglobulin-like domains protein 3 n=1 Tax=Mycetomoellerius zeteki TaxID=64791 RepID=A0A151X1F1_9HYME|nr:PREDICTED: slit homolog 1 protein-like [Trachymyrmex zeteki]XP_018305146.1 PREDICTED: slit homolog 1 protein-like [Trachymyrmex zeteki]KYQ54198.1 Leucine-rich repeats and immunoglobulin-like domains protein 3 [Trachymyrmex zeteki]